MRRFLLCLSFALSACLLQGESIHNKPAQISGILKDVFSDPTNPQYLFLYLKGTNSTSYIAVNYANDEITSLLENSIGSEISVSGLMSDNGAFFPTRDYPRPYANTELIVNNHRAIVCLTSIIAFGAEPPMQMATLRWSGGTERTARRF